MPKLDHGSLDILEDGRLPRLLDCSVVVWARRTPVHLQYYRLTEYCVDLVMFDNPRAAPCLIVAPCNKSVSTDDAMMKVVDISYSYLDTHGRCLNPVS